MLTMAVLGALGFLFEAEKPVSILDVPITDARARTAFLKRLERWRAEGKLSREEYEHCLFLCEHEWKSSDASLP
jgi:hypothetical protein